MQQTESERAFHVNAIGEARYYKRHVTASRHARQLKRCSRQVHDRGCLRRRGVPNNAAAFCQKVFVARRLFCRRFRRVTKVPRSTKEEWRRGPEDGVRHSEQ